MAGTRKIVLVIEYDGSRYYGFQLQAGQPTVQGEIEQALRKLTGEKRRVIAASRTDTGVHAQGQVVSFRTGATLPVEVFVKGVNYYLAEDVAVKEAYVMPESFHVRRAAISRDYDYAIWNDRTRSPLRRRFSYHVPGGLDMALMQEASQALPGRHDFASFAPQGEAEIKDTVKEVYQAGFRREGRTVIFHITASSFLHHQVRNTVGALIRVGQKRMTVGEFGEVLEARKPGLAGPRAPAHGLCLVRVNYPVSLREASEECTDENISD